MHIIADAGCHSGCRNRCPKIVSASRFRRWHPTSAGFKLGVSGGGISPRRPRGRHRPTLKLARKITPLQPIGRPRNSRRISSNCRAMEVPVALIGCCGADTRPSVGRPTRHVILIAISVAQVDEKGTNCLQPAATVASIQVSKAKPFDIVAQ